MPAAPVACHCCYMHMAAGPRSLENISPVSQQLQRQQEPGQRMGASACERVGACPEARLTTACTRRCGVCVLLQIVRVFGVCQPPPGCSVSSVVPVQTPYSQTYTRARQHIGAPRRRQSRSDRGSPAIRLSCCSGGTSSSCPSRCSCL